MSDGWSDRWADDGCAEEPIASGRTFFAGFSPSLDRDSRPRFNDDDLSMEVFSACRASKEVLGLFSAELGIFSDDGDGDCVVDL